MTLLHILDLLSVFVFALVGARVAADRGLDYGGIALVALNVEASVATIIGGVVVVLVRMLSIQFNLNLPKFKQEQT